MHVDAASLVALQEVQQCFTIADSVHGAATEHFEMMVMITPTGGGENRKTTALDFEAIKRQARNHKKDLGLLCFEPEVVHSEYKMLVSLDDIANSRSLM